MSKTTKVDAVPGEVETPTREAIAREAAREFAKANRAVIERNAGYYTPGAGVEQREAVGEIQALAELRAAIELEIRAAIARSRKAGNSYYESSAASWELIGAALGVSKQSAQSRYGK